MPAFSIASMDRLATCDHRLIMVCNDAIEITDFTVLEGHRGQAEQDAAFAAGKSKKPWPTGNHNALPSRAVDLIPYVEYPIAASHYDWDDLIAFGRLMGIIQACAFRRGISLRFGLDWNGNFRTVGRDKTETFLDAPHVELLGE